MLEFLHKRPHPPRTHHYARVLVVGKSVESAWKLAEPLGACGLPAIPVAVEALPTVEEAEHSLSAVVLTPELTTEEKQEACTYLKMAESFQDAPIIAILSLAEGTLQLPADYVIHLPVSYSQVLALLKQVVRRGTPALQPAVA
ncbi:MAG: hypothetical protein HYY02_07375 [Chloroflexi bacterium]|nr:hypothetical protein [Chloroflexota bacterium]